VVLNILFSFPIDDSLRHVGLAFGNLKSWGEVYPFSYYEEFKGFNPWFGYDLSLRLIASILKYLPIPLLLLQFLLTKSISLLFTLTFCFLILLRADLLDKIKDRITFTMALSLFIAILVFPLYRIGIARPFAFGIFFLIYSVDQKGVLRGALSSLVLIFFYPYLAWFYIFPVAFIHFLRGDKKFAIGAISPLIIFFLMAPPSFWGLLAVVIKTNFTRNTIINVKIDEFICTLKFWGFYLYLGGFLICYPRFSKNTRRLNYPNMLILIYFFPALMHARFFIDLILPLLFISFGNDLMQVVEMPFKELMSSWHMIVQSDFATIKSTKKRKSSKDRTKKGIPSVGSSRSLKPYIAILYILIFIILIHTNIKQVLFLKGFRNDLEPVPQGSLVLSSFNLQYKILYLRPDISIIPSCEINFAQQNIIKEYTDFFNKGFLVPLFRKTGAKYFLENSDMYINPQEGRFLKLLKQNKNFKLWKIIDLNKELNS
jgi:hypothetical protein